MAYSGMGILLLGQLTPSLKTEFIPRVGDGIPVNLLTFREGEWMITHLMCLLERGEGALSNILGARVGEGSNIASFRVDGPEG